jgi:hypothetical protein
LRVITGNAIERSLHALRVRVKKVRRLLLVLFEARLIGQRFIWHKKMQVGTVVSADWVRPAGLDSTIGGLP